MLSPLFDGASIVRRMGTEGTSRLNSVCASYCGVDFDSLLKQLCLHMPRMSFPEIMNTDCVIKEAERLAARVAILRREYLSEVPKQCGRTMHVRDLRFEPIEERIPKLILERFHYLLSHRLNSLHFGLFESESRSWPLAMVSLSTFDLYNLQSNSALPMNCASTMVVSRVYAFDSAPSNSISFLLGKLRQWLNLNRPEVSTLLTYVNPNIGFSGSSYTADNWTEYGEERDTRYVYVDLDYKTDRFLVETYGTANLGELREHFGDRISTSLSPLLPLRVYARAISNERILCAPKSFSRWTPSLGG